MERPRRLGATPSNGALRPARGWSWPVFCALKLDHTGPERAACTPWVRLREEI